MGARVNGVWMRVAGWTVATLIVGLNALLIVLTLVGQG
jgi:Mn2+/Fe2+ NRAMP family transporter